MVVCFFFPFVPLVLLLIYVLGIHAFVMRFYDLNAVPFDRAKFQKDLSLFKRLATTKSFPVQRNAVYLPTKDYMSVLRCSPGCNWATSITTDIKA